MSIKGNERFENHIDFSSPETIGDAEKITDFENGSDAYDDQFDELLSRAEHSSWQNVSDNFDIDKDKYKNHYCKENERSSDSEIEKSMGTHFSKDLSDFDSVTESKVDTNFQFGDGGGTQYFISNASVMKMDGRLVQISAENLKTNGDILPKVEYKSSSGYTVLRDQRLLTKEETEQLLSMTDYDKSSANSVEDNMETSQISKEELNLLDENTLDVPALTKVMDGSEQQQKEDWKHQLSDQESSGGLVFPDGIKNPRKLLDGERFFQLSPADNTRESPYFTDKKTVDSCRNFDGQIDVSSLLEKLQIPPKMDENGRPYTDYILREFEYRIINKTETK